MSRAGAEISEVARCSEDRVVTMQGKIVLGMLNAVDMVVMNGVKESEFYEFSSGW